MQDASSRLKETGSFSHVASGMCGGSRCCRKILLTSEANSEMAPSITVPRESKKAPDQQTEEEPPIQHSVEHDIQGSLDQKSVADLSDDKDMQKAIAMSIEDQQQHHLSKIGGDQSFETATGDSMIITAEDREVSRALEESLREIPMCVVRAKSNPAERKRQSCEPVGLVNIGNSCWFNVVSQPLFHIPGFRDMILNYKQHPPSATSLPQSKDGNSSSPKVAECFSKLFALMLASEQKYITPSECVHLFQEDVSEGSRNKQEDVCEFIHKLLERLENEFKDVCRAEGEEKESSGTSKDEQFRNPLVKFFYGQFQKESKDSSSSEESSLKQETFGQFPLHVLKYGDIHDSILASMSERPQDSLSVNPDSYSAPEGLGHQDSWFNLLPPVLIFSLGRYEFSQATLRTEKVHNKFEFPERLYMDRYMENNKVMVQQKHIQVAAIKKQLASLNATLSQYQNYGDGPRKYPLKDILASTLQFVETASVKSTSQEIDQESATPTRSLPELETKSTEFSTENICNSAECGINFTDNVEEMEVIEVDHVNGKKHILQHDHLTASYSSPKASEIGPDEQMTFRNCLSLWHSQVQTVENELCDHISKLKGQLKDMYSEPELQHTAYQLHAVVIHEGQASAGHYWVYIRDKEEWKKYNDVQVSKSSWQELQQDSLGGQNNASAYCLMYTDTTRHELLFPTHDEVIKDLRIRLQTLPIQLQEHVKQDNLSFEKELTKLNHRTVSFAATSNESPRAERSSVPPPTAPNSPSQTNVFEYDVSFFILVSTVMVKRIKILLKNQFDEIVHENTTKINANETDFYTLAREFTFQLIRVVRDEVNKLAEDFIEKLIDIPCLLDFGIFLIHSKACNYDKILHLHSYCVLRQLALDTNSTDPMLELVIQLSNQAIGEFRTKYSHITKAYKVYQNKFKILIETVWHMVMGWKAFDQEKFEKALPYFIKSSHLHEDLIEVITTDEKEYLGSSSLCTVPAEVFVECRCRCLLAVNGALIKRFLASDTARAADEAMMAVTDILVPTLAQLASQGRKYSCLVYI